MRYGVLVQSNGHGDFFDEGLRGGDEAWGASMSGTGGWIGAVISTNAAIRDGVRRDRKEGARSEGRGGGSTTNGRDEDQELQRGGDSNGAGRRC